MALTIDYKEGVLKDLREDPAMAREYYREAVRAIVNGDVEEGGIMLRDLVNSGTACRATWRHARMSP